MRGANNSGSTDANLATDVMDSSEDSQGKHSSPTLHDVRSLFVFRAISVFCSRTCGHAEQIKTDVLAMFGVHARDEANRSSMKRFTAPTCACVLGR